MPARYRIEVDGMSELRRAFRKAGEDMEDFREVNRQAAAVAGAAALARTPRRSGRLASSFRTSGTITAANIRFGSAAIPYAGVIHWGTPNGYGAGKRGPHNIDARLWATGAAADTEPQWSLIYEHFIDLVLQRAGF